MVTAVQAIRDAGLRAAAETAAGAAGVRRGTGPTALVDTRLLGETSDVQWRTRR